MDTNLPGNPYSTEGFGPSATKSDLAWERAEAIRALAFEQRTANLIAAYSIRGALNLPVEMETEIVKRLGQETAPNGVKHTDLLFLWNEVQLAGDAMLQVDTDDVWQRFTCSEIEWLGDIFRAAGRKDVRDFIVREHMDHDAPGDLERHAYNEEDPE